MMQRNQRVGWMVCVGVLCGMASSAYAQGRPVDPATVVPLKVTVVLSRHAADTPNPPLSRLPFEVWVNTAGTATVRIGSDVPVPSAPVAGEAAEGKATPVVSYQYRAVGTSLTVEAHDLGDGRYRLALSIDDSQLVPARGQGVAGAPRALTQNFRTSTAVILRDGQTVQHSLASDKVSGEVIRVEVSVAVVK